MPLKAKDIHVGHGYRNHRGWMRYVIDINANGMAGYVEFLHMAAEPFVWGCSVRQMARWSERELTPDEMANIQKRLPSCVPQKDACTPMPMTTLTIELPDSDDADDARPPTIVRQPDDFLSTFENSMRDLWICHWKPGDSAGTVYSLELDWQPQVLEPNGNLDGIVLDVAERMWLASCALVVTERIRFFKSRMYRPA